MGTCCHKNQDQSIELLEVKISARQLKAALDPNKASLKNYLKTKSSQMQSKVQEVYNNLFENNTKSVIIINRQLPKRQIKFLAIALRYYTTLQILNLRGNSLGNTGAKLISSVFQYITKIKNLFIEDNQIKSEGIKEICKSLHNLSSLESLSLSQNILGDAVGDLSNGLSFLSNLLELHLDFMEMNSNDFNTLSPYLCICSKLRRIGVGYNKLDSGCISALFLVMNSLADLKQCIISGIDISDGEIDRIIITFTNINIMV
jgi:hypothetical protein